MAFTLEDAEVVGYVAVDGVFHVLVKKTVQWRTTGEPCWQWELRRDLPNGGRFLVGSDYAATPEEAMIDAARRVDMVLTMEGR